MSRLPWLLVLVLCVGPACSRKHHRLRADRDAYCLLTEKTVGTPWQIPYDYSIYPDPDSRLADPSPPDCPWLPSPGPMLYGDLSEESQITPDDQRMSDEELIEEEVPAEIAEMLELTPPSIGETDLIPPPTPEQNTPELKPGENESLEPPPLPTPLENSRRSRSALELQSAIGAGAPSLIANASGTDARPIHQADQQNGRDGRNRAMLRRLPLPPDADHTIQLVTYLQPGTDPPLPADGGVQPVEAADDEQLELSDQPYGIRSMQLAFQSIPLEYWNALPKSCRDNMLAFQSVQAEYQASAKLDEIESDDRRQLSLRDVIDIALKNSREYQTQKERLYAAALNVSLERFDYQLRFSPNGNGTTLDYSHDRFNGETINRLRIPTAFQVERMLARGGNFVARFANEVLLTFNGPQGFTSDVSSDLFFELTQSILQRDVLLEPLIQSERDLVYAAREFARFRKEFFFGVASQYYGILRTYRAIEIDSQNYFSLVRTVEQAQAEVSAGVKNAPNRVAVDQFEQSMLSGRSNLIETCNRLASSLDQFKLTLGLPTDQPIAIDLAELEELTRLDQVEVTVERVRRWLTRVEQKLSQVPFQRADLLNDTTFLLQRMQEWNALRSELGEEFEQEDELNALILLLSVAQARSEVERNETEYGRVVNSTGARPPIRVFLRSSALLDSRLMLLDRQLRQASANGLSSDEAQSIIRRWVELEQGLRATRASLAEGPDAAGLQRLVGDLQPLLDVSDGLVNQLDRINGYERDLTQERRNELAIAVAKRVMRLAEPLVAQSRTGLPEVDIDVNDAMLTALIQRLDMMNERGALADTWRRVKLAADDLRSVLNLSANHSLRTDKNEPFDFDFDDSSTNVRLSFDLPLNRRAQRNRYRGALINYQAGRRGVMELEDNIKFDIRDGLRTLELTRVQYPISVAQAALAAEQVTSIRLQLALGTPNVRGRDLLDALQGSREALTSVANSRIGYLVDRARFVLDLELMQLDEEGFWPQINDAQYQPEPNLVYPETAGPTYGHISRCVKPSKLMYHLYCHPRPGELIESRDSESYMGEQYQEGEYLEDEVLP